MLTEITTQIAQTLATQVRVLTTEQLAQHSYIAMKQPEESARRAARTLQREGYVHTWPTMAVHLDLHDPLLIKPPGDTPELLGKLAWQNQRRWTDVPPTKTVCLASTEQSRAAFGGSCRAPRPRELEHDINVAQIYLTLMNRSPEVAVTWTHEDALMPGDAKRPDAVIERQGELVAIDLLGRGYPRKKIEALCQHYRQSQLELW